MSVSRELGTRSAARALTIFPRVSTSADNTGIRDAAQFNQTRNTSSDVVELLISYALILSANWTPNPVRQQFYWMAAVWIGGSTAVSFIRSRSIEFRMTGFRRSLWIVGVALVVASAAVAIAANAHTLQQPYGPMDGAEAFAGYAVWAIAQQWLLLGYFLPRVAQRTPREGRAAAIVAGAFAVAHLPNLILAVMALLWGLAAGFLFLRFRSIVTLGFAHAILGIAVAVSIPGPVLHNMRVGLAYLQYQRPAETGLEHDDHRVTKVMWNRNHGQAPELQPTEQPQK
ncbi:MAG TPA: CPBP family glutamic-type intramembrane protease [Terracidiphilus sp.]|nr:CPBP family glutamic-type intramembrane protease [Terracidiphilus sp.]